MNIVHPRLIHRGGLLAAAFAALALALLIPGGEALADDNALLEKVDKQINKWKRLDYHYKIVTKTASGDKTTLRLRVRMRRKKGHNQQLVEISEPADMKGTKVLTRSDTEMYIYLPQYKKIRRIASHVTEQGFLGTSLSQRDLTLTRYGRFYNAVKTAEGQDTFTLTLSAKNDDAPYPKIELVVRTDRMLPKLIRYYSEGGKHIKTEKRTQYKCKKSYCAPGAMKMVDHTKGVTSILYLTKFKVNPKIKASVFSKRSLK